MSSYDTTEQNKQNRMVTGLFPDRASAERAYNSISTRGYGKDDINLMMSDSSSPTGRQPSMRRGEPRWAQTPNPCLRATISPEGEKSQWMKIRGGRAGELGAHVPPDEIDEVRIVATYLSSHPELPQLPLVPVPAGEQLERLVEAAAASGPDLSERMGARRPPPGSPALLR